jgi:hypothetical protein
VTHRGERMDSVPAFASGTLIDRRWQHISINRLAHATIGRPIRCDRKAEWIVTERFERHRQPWTAEELQKLRLLAGKGMALKAIAKAMTRSEESIKDRAKRDGIGIAKLR